MKRISLLLCTIVCFALTPGLAYAQESEKGGSGPQLLSSNAEGTHFIIGFMQNEIDDPFCPRGYPHHRVSIASRFHTKGLIHYPTGVTVQFEVDPFEIREFSFNGSLFECIGDGICEKSFEITSEEPINVYCFSSKTHTSDGYLALPVSSWGTEYITPNFATDHYTPDPLDPIGAACDEVPRGGEFAVIAAEDNTTVTIVPKATTRGNYTAGIPVNRTLQKGEMWQVQDAGFLRGGSDLTGSIVRSDKPVGLLSGHMRAGVPVQFDTKDHLIEMIPPVSSHGTRHMVVPFGGRAGGDIVRVLASELGGTNVTVTNLAGTSRSYRIAGPGDFIELSVRFTTVITSDRPTLVAHYSQSNGADESSFFDPYMIVVTPEEQFVNAAIFQTMPNGDRVNGRTQFERHFVTLVAETDGFETVLLNGTPLDDVQTIEARGIVPGLPYSWITIELPESMVHVIRGDALFGGYVYGIGQFDSYGWPVGAGLRDLDAVDPRDPRLYSEPGCGGLIAEIVATDSTEFDFGLARVWLDADASENVESIDPVPLVLGDQMYRMSVSLIDPSLPGKARIIAEDISGNRDTIEIELQGSSPVFSPSAVLFSRVEVNELRDQTISITNPGTEQMVIDSMRLKIGTEFSLLGGGLLNEILSSNGSQNFQVRFRSDTPGLYRDTVIVWVDCRPHEIPLEATMIVPLINTRDLDFGTLRVGRTRCLELLVENTGEGRLRIDEVRINGRRFTFDPTDSPDGTIWLESGEDTVLIICFEPDAVGEFTGTVEFISNAAGGDSVANLRGEGIYPEIFIGGYDFGAIQVGDTSCSRVPIVNTGSDTAFLTGIQLDDKTIFLPDESIFPYALPPGDTMWVPVCFIPGDERGYSTPVIALNDDGLEAANTLIGAGYRLLAEIDGYDWGPRWVGSAHDTIVHIRNLSNQAIEVTRVWLDNGDNGDFNITVPVPRITLQPSEEYPINVQFTPLMRGARSVGIYAETTSRVRPVIENLLEGFGLEAIPNDELDHDSSDMYACDARVSRVNIFNRGNAPLTVDQITIDEPLGLASLKAPNSGYQIPVGNDPLELEITFDPQGYIGEISATITWSFVELPGEQFSRKVVVNTTQQLYQLSLATPPSISNTNRFDLIVSVDDAVLDGIVEDELELDITYDPTMTIFDMSRWNDVLADNSGTWSFVGQPSFLHQGRVVVTLRPTLGSPVQADGVSFPGLPFRGFISSRNIDTFTVRMATPLSECVTPSVAQIPYSIEGICGLNHRLFVFTGKPPALEPSRPNPATTSTQVAFTIPFDGETTLELYSADGKLSEMIVDEVLSEGTHSVTIDVSDMPNGVYYYRLIHGTFTEVKRLIIAK